MKVDITDQVALVTGSAHRVGRSIALALAKAGVHILIHYNSSDDSTVRNTLHDIKSHGVDALSVQADISTPAGVERVFTSLWGHFQRLNILVNSASLFQANRLLETSLIDWQRSLDVNLTAPFLCTQAAAKLMRENTPSSGAIINICDYGSIKPWPERVDHNVSKAALWMLTQVSAVSLGPLNIRVNGILPGPVMKSPGLTDQQWQEIGARAPLGRTGEAEDVARAVVFLCGEDYITGTLLAVNGGETL